jgi:hypothetical protein
VIREHGRSVEADLAYLGIDLRDLYRRGSGMTLRRLWVLIEGLPYESNTRTAARSSKDKSLTSVDRLRERQAHYSGAST